MMDSKHEAEHALRMAARALTDSAEPSKAQVWVAIAEAHIALAREIRLSGGKRAQGKRERFEFDDYDDLAAGLR